MRRATLRPALTALLAALALAALPACGGGSGSDGSTGGKRRIVVGSKLDAEAQILAWLMATQLEAKGYDVRRKIPVGGTTIVRKALVSGQIDIYWEFTGSGLNTLGEKPIGDPQAAYARVKELDAAQGVTWMAAARLNDTYALAARPSGPMAARSLSELAGNAPPGQPGRRLCVDPEGGFRDDVLPLLASAYGLTFAETTQLGHDLIPAALAEGRCALGVVYSTAALIAKHGLVTLDDDKAAFGAYTPAPIVRTDRLGRWPSLPGDLAALTAALDTPTITRLNARVDIDKVPAERVAREFLRQRGLISGASAGKAQGGG